MSLVVRDLAADERISQPGVFGSVPMALYHSGELCDGPSISSSGLRTIFTRSPAHYWATSPLNPDRAEREESRHFAVGRALHHLLLGEADFSRHFAVRPEKWDSWRSKDAQEWRRAQEDNCKTVIVPSDLDMVEKVRASLALNPAVQSGILNGWIETTVATRDEATGVWLLARPDVLPSDSGEVVDYKSCVSVAADDIERSISSYRYDMQAAVVRRCLRETIGLDMTSFFLVWSEKTDPFCTQVTSLPMGEVTLAEDDVQVALRVFARCLETGVWPGPGGTQSDGMSIGLTSWALKRAEERRNFLLKELET